jgi:DNA-binding NtrC family response regulator
MEKRTVLFVDDEEKILKSLKRGLLDEPYNTLFATSGKEAIEILQREEVHIIVTDMRMPEMSGLDLLRMVKEEYPHIIRVVLSGYTAIDTLLRAINEGEILRFICKPWSSEEFKTIIRQAIEYYDIHSEREMLMTFFEQLIEGTEPDRINFRLIQTMLSNRKRHLYEWSKKCNSIL